MKNVNEFRIYGQNVKWVKDDEVKNDPYPCWWLIKGETAILCAMENKRSNRGITLCLFSLTGQRTEFVLKPENGIFNTIDLGEFWANREVV